MGLFTRRAQPVDPNTANSVGDTTNGTNGATATPTREKHGRNAIMGRHERTPTGYVNSRPTFGQWLKGTWIDLLTMVAMGIIGLGVSKASPSQDTSP